MELFEKHVSNQRNLKMLVCIFVWGRKTFLIGSFRNDEVTSIV